jgi:hypothetical protein
LAQLISLRDAQNEAVETYAQLLDVSKGKRKALDAVKKQLDEAGVSHEDLVCTDLLG